MSRKIIRVEIYGRVQNVWFRAWTCSNALELGLDGWVRNRVDGSVEALFSGMPDAVDEMVARCHVGPPAAQVLRVTSSESAEAPRPGFRQEATT